jgi:hypothetical protein
MLPFSMVVANPTQLPRPSLRVPCVLCVKTRLEPRPTLSLLFTAKSRKIRTYENHAHKLFRMNTSKTLDLKSFRIRTYKKPGGGGPWHRLQSVLRVHYRASAAKGPAQRAATRATSIPSSTYFTILWIPRVGGTSFRPNAIQCSLLSSASSQVTNDADHVPFISTAEPS